jgi:hypothetical protein
MAGSIVRMRFASSRPAGNVRRDLNYAQVGCMLTMNNNLW